MNSLLKLIFSCVLFFGLNSHSVYAAEQNVQAELIHQDASIQPGHPFLVAVHLKIADNWHTYWKNPGDAGMATSIEWTLPEGFTASPIIWPAPERFMLEGIVGYGYEKEVVLLTRITPPESLSLDPITINADIRWLVCSDIQCVPGSSEHSISMPVLAEAPQPHSQWASIFEKAQLQLPNKQENIQVNRTVDTFNVSVQLPEGIQDKLTELYFAPEEGKTVDHTVKGEIVAPTNKGEPHQLIFKMGKDGSSVKELKGVIVGKGDEHKTVFATELDAPIINASQLVAEQDIPISDQAAFIPESDQTLGLGMALLFALIGGSILNLMPCVLPIISLKVFSFVKMSQQGRSVTLKHGFAFFFGVIFSFWVLAGALLVLKSYGNSVGWGFQLQEPLFVAILATLLLTFGLSMFGVFEIGHFASNIAGKLQTGSAKQERLSSSFMSGVLATTVATPCTGPFLGSAIGFAFTVPAIECLLIFTVLGTGMALPYVILAAYPNLLKFIPKPGAWMDTFKSIMGFMMLATVIWLTWVFSAQTGNLGVTLLLVAFFWVAVACWIYGRWCSPVNSSRSRKISLIFIISCLLAAGMALKVSTASWMTESQPQESVVASIDKIDTKKWIPYSPQLVKELQSKGIPVFIDFTAKWCLICQVNHLVLTDNDVEAKFAEMGVVKMKADWTKKDPVITEELERFGRNGVPLYVLYGSDPSTPVQVLPQVLTPSLVIDTLNTVQQIEAQKSSEGYAKVLSH